MKDGDRFQWIRGDDIGKVEEFSDISVEDNIEWIIFKSGNRVNKSLIAEFMFQLEPGMDPLELGNLDNVSVPGVSSLSPVVQHIPVQPVVEQKNPIESLLDKQKKLHKLKLSIQLNIEVPNKKLFDILEDSYGDDILDTIVNRSLKQTNTKDFKKMISESIKGSIIDFYKSKNKNIQQT